MTRSDVLVIGGGIIGLACARALAAAGLAVEVVERQPSGSAASMASAGMLTTVADLPREFVDICREARDEWPGFRAGLEQESGRPVEHDDEGALVLALSNDEAAGFDAYMAAIRAAGEAVEEMPVAELRRRVPDASPETRRALLLPGEQRVDNVQVCEALAQALARDPHRLAALREKLARHRLTQPLFDCVRFTRHLEAAYRRMAERQRAGLPPEDIVIAPL